MRDSYRAFFRKAYNSKLIFGAIVIMFLTLAVKPILADPPIGAFYYPPGNIPPGPPPNYNQVDTSYFSGTPVLPLPPPDSGGIYVWVDSTGWNVANHIYSRGNSYEQFHGSVLAILDSPPSPGVNVFSNGFELISTPGEPSSPDSSCGDCYMQNDRWGWYQWSENLYEIWWDVTTREWKHGDGDPNDFMIINIAGCAIDFNVWSSGHGGPFDTDQVFLGGSMFPLSNVPGFVDTYPGITDPYQSQAGSDPEHDPNITIFEPISGTGESYNKDGLIISGQTYTCGQVLGQNYGDRFAGGFVYEGNGIQFSSSCLTDPCQFNDPPIAGSPADTAIFVCELNEICLPGFSFSDPNNNILSVEVIGGTLNGDVVCFTPIEGQNTLTLIVTDECGESDTATTNIFITLNSPPTVTCPNDTSIFVCDLSDICIPGFSFSDPEGNFDYFEVIGGVYNNGTVCFTPVEGLNTITLIKGDSCGERDTCETNITVTLNSSPQAGSPNDTSMFVCDLSQICLPGFTSSDSDGNIASVDVTGGTLNNNEVCFTPVAGANTITMIVTDDCGEADTTITIVTIDLNEPPVASSPADTSMFVCDLSQICLPGFTYSDSDSNIASVDVTGGTFNNNEVCFTPVAGANTITMIVTDDCGEADTTITVVAVAVNNAPTANCLSDTTIVVCDLAEICLPGFGYADDNNNLETIDILGGTFDNGNICFTPVEGENIIAITVTDSCGLSAACTTLVTIIPNTPPTIACINDTTIVADDLLGVCLDNINITDAEDNIASVYVNGDSMTGEEICFVAAPGINTVTIIATDVCGLADTCQLDVIVGLCAFLPGDANADMVVNGLDIVIMVNFFKMGPALPDTCDCRPDVEIYPFFGAGDTNGDCHFNGLDVTYLMSFFLSEVDEILYCPSCPPTEGWITSVEGGEIPKATTSKPGGKSNFNSLK